MYTGTLRRGRPCYRALLDLENDRKLELMDEFYRACARFHYQEVVQLSRTLQVNPNTIYRWKYKLSFPRSYDVALAIINWVQQGKPNEEVPRIQDEVSLLD